MRSLLPKDMGAPVREWKSRATASLGCRRIPYLDRHGRVGYGSNGGNWIDVRVGQDPDLNALIKRITGPVMMPSNELCTFATALPRALVA